MSNSVPFVMFLMIDEVNQDYVEAFSSLSAIFDRLNNFVNYSFYIYKITDKSAIFIDHVFSFSD